MDNTFVGILSGQDESNNVKITLVAAIPPPPPPSPPGTVQKAPASPAGLPNNTITIDGQKGQISAGGGGHAGAVTVLNPTGHPIVALNATGAAVSVLRVLGAVAAEIVGDPDALLHLYNATGKRTIKLDSKGGSGWFGGQGVDGDVLVFAAGVDASSSSQAAVWIKGSTGDVILQNADCAEDFDVLEDPGIEPGSVLTMSEEGPLTLSSVAYDRKVAGIISGAGGLRPGIVLGRISAAGSRWPIALSGKVFCKVDASESPIAVGDLLTTSHTPGHAMAARDHARAFGAVIGKALAPLRSGTGMLPVLVALQ